MRGHTTFRGKPKTAYATKAEAKLHRDNHRLNSHRPTSVYKCKCGFYHVGRVPMNQVWPKVLRKARKMEEAREEYLVGQVVHQLRTMLDKGE